MDIYLKSEGQYVKKELSEDDYLNWFKSNTNDEGEVQEDCMIYKDGDLSVNTDKSITFIMSDDSLDREFERFDTAGWDLKSYKKNPVLLWSHDRSIPAIGKMDKVRVKDNNLLGNPVFDEQDELANRIKAKIDGGFIKSGSVGFFPSKIEIPEDDKNPCKLIYRKQELREFSICNVPANPHATVLNTEGKAVGIGHSQPPHTITPPDAIAIITIEDWQDKCDKIEDMKIDIENLKEMQIKMADTQAKADIDYYEELLMRKKPQSQGLDELFQT